MGVLAAPSQVVSDAADAAASGMADTAVSQAVLKPMQIQEVESKRRKYLEQMPDMQGEDAQKSVKKLLGSIGIEVYQAYLEMLEPHHKLYSPVDAVPATFDADNRIRFFDITKWVVDKTEKSLDKLVNVYHVLSGADCNIALIYHRTETACRVTIGIVNTSAVDSDPAVADAYYSRITGALSGNFPGAEIHGINGDFGIGIPICLQDSIGGLEKGSVKSVAIVSNVPSEKSENFQSQNMEKLLDGIVPQNSSEEYTLILLAKPVKNQLEEKNRLYELYSRLSPYSSWQTGYSYNENYGNGSFSNVGVNAGVSIGTGVGSPVSASGNFGVSFGESANVSMQTGKGETTTQTYTNFGIKHTLEIIEAQIKRIEESAALGMWEFAAYVTSDSPTITHNVAHMYLALTQGSESYLSKSAVNFWDGDIDAAAAKTILKSIQKLQHPVFGLRTSRDGDWLMYPAAVTPAAVLSGKELAKALNFPQKSVCGLPVMKVTSFGREVLSVSNAVRDLRLGSTYHMHQTEHTDISLNRQSLTAHTFITGSTGAGKSNTIYHMLDELTRDGSVKFMVIEPAKGEYKDVFGGRSDVQVYSTNPRKAKLLRINPFAFPVDEISVQEHLDRLVEIFNVCWPMYAAMPAILKDACERAYAAAGWDIAASINWKQENSFPCFADVLEQIKKVLEESAYSADNKSDYTGALVTRIRSLTTGIYGQVFTNDTAAALFGEKLFDENVIVDLSRVGSTETKSLIMGLLVMQMQEYRMSSAKEANSALKHITVLEEAHNILKRTSTEQSAESANLAGKSVEMLSNAIAEMRTYGEGFIIADQAPGLLDMAAIRNTNTKIIMRLPDEEDRKLVGKAAGLNDDQIVELSKLPTGVAAVYQNDWIEPVLCKIPRFENAQPLKYTPEARGRLSTTLSKYFTAVSRQERPDSLSGEEIDTIRRWSRTVSSSEDTIRLVERSLQGSLDKENVGVLCYNLLDGGMLCESVVRTDAGHLQDVVPTYLVKRFGFDGTLAGALCNLILMAAANDYPEQRLQIEQRVELLKLGGEVQ